MRRLVQVSAALLLSGCVGLPELSSVSPCQGGREPRIFLSDDGKTAFTHLDVLTYNIEGLSWPARSGRAGHLRAIAAHLAELRAAGQAPDVVMFQEVFSRTAVRAAIASSYPTVVPGPVSRRPRRRSAGPLPGRANPTKGELGLKFLSSGILIATDHPVTAHRARPFARGSCAGFDCLASKGVMFARISVPGVPQTIDLFNTHLNSTRASRVPEPRHLEAHRKQLGEVRDFVISSADAGNPIIFGGDFNMRQSEARFSQFGILHPLELVHRYCIERAGECDVRASWDGDEPWMDTQDLQLFRSGELVTLRPVLVRTMFDGGAGGPRLSDHDGFRVTYQLIWPASAGVRRSCSAGALALKRPISHMRAGSRADGALANPVRSGRKQP